MMGLCCVCGATYRAPPLTDFQNPPLPTRRLTHYHYYHHYYNRDENLVVSFHGKESSTHAKFEQTTKGDFRS